MLALGSRAASQLTSKVLDILRSKGFDGRGGSRPPKPSLSHAGPNTSPADATPLPVVANPNPRTNRLSRRVTGSKIAMKPGQAPSG